MTDISVLQTRLMLFEQRFFEAEHAILALSSTDNDRLVGDVQCLRIGVKLLALEYDDARGLAAKMLDEGIAYSSYPLEAVEALVLTGAWNSYSQLPQSEKHNESAHHFSVALLASALGDVHRAVTVYENLCADEDPIVRRKALARVVPLLFDTKQFGRASALVEAFLAATGDEQSALALDAWIYLSSNETTDPSRFRRFQPDIASPLLASQLASLFGRLGEWRLSFEYALAYLRANPWDDRMVFILGDTSMRIGDAESTISSFESLIGPGELRVPALARLRAFLFKERRFRELISLARRLAKE
ncbi:MAG: hypothetical protein HZC36_08070 [Armatimonadetes bacterium]|nr:hypothetical protein [Armatimonadota bacterium]